MKQLVTFVLLFLFVPFATSQNWTYKSTGNDFDGKIRTARIDGKGGEFPYNTPSLIINYFESDKSLNFYIIDMGYTGCDNNLAVFIIDGSKRFKTTSISDNAENTALFFETFESTNSIEYSNLQLLEMLQLLQSGSRLSIRVSNDCYQRDFTFTLSGSTAAINYVLGRDFENELAGLKLRQLEAKTAKQQLSQKIQLSETTEVLNGESKGKIIEYVYNLLLNNNISTSTVHAIQVQFINYNKWYIEIITLDSQSSNQFNTIHRKIIQL